MSVSDQPQGKCLLQGADSWQVLDLSQAVGPATPAWPEWPGFSAEIVCKLEYDGIYDRTLSLPEHTGTHLDAPAHLDPKGRFVHELALSELVVPCVVIDLRPMCGDDQDFAVQADHIARFEADHGQIPSRSAVLICTGWDRYLSLPEAYIGPSSGPPRCPGLSVDAMHYLVRRKIIGVGIDTLSMDPGNMTDLPAHRIGLSAGLWHLEGLIGLHRLPAVGAWVVVAVMPIVDGSGAPARVLCLVPSK